MEYFLNLWFVTSFELLSTYTEYFYIKHSHEQFCIFRLPYLHVLDCSTKPEFLVETHVENIHTDIHTERTLNYPFKTKTFLPQGDSTTNVGTFPINYTFNHFEGPLVK